MRRYSVIVTALAGLVGYCAAPVLADSTGPLGGYDGVGGFVDVKSPPLADSDVFVTGWGMHVTFAFTNYAGFLFDLQYDGHEMSDITVSPAGPHVGMEGPGFGGGLHPLLTFPGSQSSPQVVSPIAAWIDPGIAQQSGMSVNTSSMVPLFQISGHVKNSTPANNSDIDVSISAWQILHIVNSGTYHLSESMWLYVTPAGDFASAPGAGGWIHHIGTTTNTFIHASAFVATNAFIQNVAGFGIEHIPEPAAGVLLLAGLGIISAGRRWGRRAA